MVGLAAGMRVSGEGSFMHGSSATLLGWVRKGLFMTEPNYEIKEEDVISGENSVKEVREIRGMGCQWQKNNILQTVEEEKRIDICACISVRMKVNLADLIRV
ncbi:hypothetical protein VNO77_34097 [Canavalia gladiata]|uniref:Uncharacterized protein n=1 Tax=Canavalia gladiata TaxID=3824 RepID=A0AAN9PY99_CANGL